MLVLSRRLGERIIIGEGADRITVTVVDIDRGKIRLGITAPPGVPIYREELPPLDHDRRAGNGPAGGRGRLRSTRRRSAATFAAAVGEGGGRSIALGAAGKCPEHRARRPARCRRDTAERIRRKG